MIRLTPKSNPGSSGSSGAYIPAVDQHTNSDLGQIPKRINFVVFDKICSEVKEIKFRGENPELIRNLQQPGADVEKILKEAYLMPYSARLPDMIIKLIQGIVTPTPMNRGSGGRMDTD